MDVKLNVRSVHFDADQKLIDFIQEKIKLENVSNLENKTVEIRVNIPGNDLFAKKTSKSFEESTDEVTEALRRQIKRHKEKVRG